MSLTDDVIVFCVFINFGFNILNILGKIKYQSKSQQQNFQKLDLGSLVRLSEKAETDFEFIPEFSLEGRLILGEWD